MSEARCRVVSPRLPAASPPDGPAEIPFVDSDPRVSAILAEVEELDERAAAFAIKAEGLGTEIRSLSGEGRRTAMARWVKAGSDPARRPPDVADLQAELARISESQVAIGEVRGELSRELALARDGVSREIIAGLAGDYASIVGRLGPALDELARVLEDEEAFVAQLESRGVVLRSLRRPEPPFSPQELDGFRATINAIITT
jgi:hypothetical protein